MAKKPEPVLIWCRGCDTGYGSTGEKPAACPSCGSGNPRWTRTPPYKPTVNDKRFLRSLRIDPD